MYTSLQCFIYQAINIFFILKHDLYVSIVFVKQDVGTYTIV
jgi:hypothetical protein